jgi:hypothetical protein
MTVKSGAIQPQLAQINEREVEVTKKLVQQFYGLVNKG